MCTRSQLENAERKADDEVVSLGADSGAQCARVHSFRRWTQSKKVKLPGSRRKQSVLTGLCISGRWRAEPFASGTVCKEDMARSYFERKRNTFDEAQCEILSVQSRAAGTQVDTELAVAQFGNTCLCRCASRAELDPSLRWDDDRSWIPAIAGMTDRTGSRRSRRAPAAALERCTEPSRAALCRLTARVRHASSHCSGAVAQLPGADLSAQNQQLVQAMRNRTVAGARRKAAVCRRVACHGCAPRASCRLHWLATTQHSEYLLA
jgi:hypothetical protein